VGCGVWGVGYQVSGLVENLAPGTSHLAPFPHPLPMEHIQHSLGDGEATGDVDGAETKGDRTQNRYR
jgi:hypothetical protein